MSDMKGVGYQAYAQYLQGHVNEMETDSEEMNHCESRKKAFMIVMQFLCQCQPSDKFRYSQIADLIIDAAGMEGFDPQKVAHAFENLEKYLFLLYIMPWKQEYRRIKTYCGFYKSKIESHIPKADTILKLVGFREEKPGLLLHRLQRNTDILLYVAYECFVAYVECTIISEIWSKVQDTKVTLHQTVFVRTMNAGSVDGIADLIASKFGRSVSEDTTTAPSSTGNASTRQAAAKLALVPPSPTATTAVFHDRLHGHMKAVKKLSDDPDIPFMDDEHVPCDLEDHLLASLQIMNVKPEKEQVKGSQEWSFVREGLEKNYGKKYFDGPRKDILTDKECQDQGVGGKKKTDYVQLVAHHTYENVKNTGVLSKSEPIRSRGADQKLSTNIPAQNNMFFPPNIPPNPSEANFVPSQRKQSMTETFLHKDDHSSSQELNMPRYRTAPLASRNDPHPLPSYTYPPAQKLEQSKKITAQDNIENILKYHKQNVLKTTEQAEAYLRTPLARVVPMDVGSKSDFSPNLTSGYISSPFSISSKNSNTVEQFPKVMPNLSTEWACEKCTFKNSQNVNTCDMCFWDRRVSDSRASVEGLEMVCPRCRNRNKETSKQCNGCGTDIRLFKTV